MTSPLEYTITVATPNNNWIVNQPRTLTIKSPIVGTAASTIALSAPGSLAGGVHGTVQLLAASPNLASNITIGGPNMFVVIGDNQSFGTGNVFVNSLNSAPQLVTNGNRTLSNTMSWGSGFGLDNTSTGDLTLNGAIALTGPVGAGTNRTVNNLTATKTIFVNGDVVTSLPGDTGIRTLTLQPNPGNIIVNGKISDANSLVGALLKTQGGTATINSTNSTFAGQVQVQNGVLEVALLADQGSPSSIGSGSTTPSIQLVRRDQYWDASTYRQRRLLHKSSHTPFRQHRRRHARLIRRRYHELYVRHDGDAQCPAQNFDFCGNQHR